MARIFENLNCGPVFGYVRGVKREKKKGRLRNFSPVLEKKSQTYIKPYSDFLHKFIRIASVHKAAAAVAAKCILRIACDESTHICGRTPSCHPRLNFQWPTHATRKAKRVRSEKILMLGRKIAKKRQKGLLVALFLLHLDEGKSIIHRRSAVRQK